jgi:hypothetical protein
VDVIAFQVCRGGIDFLIGFKAQTKVVDANIACFFWAGRFSAHKHKHIAASLQVGHVDTKSVVQSEADDFGIKLLGAAQVVDAQGNLTNASEFEHRKRKAIKVSKMSYLRRVGTSRYSNV